MKNELLRWENILSTDIEETRKVGIYSVWYHFINTLCKQEYFNSLTTYLILVI
jgi:hypothetical protein